MLLQTDSFFLTKGLFSAKSMTTHILERAWPPLRVGENAFQNALEAYGLTDKFCPRQLEGVLPLLQ